jgi:hypothetical protein
MISLLSAQVFNIELTRHGASLHTVEDPSEVSKRGFHVSQRTKKVAHPVQSGSSGTRPAENAGADCPGE